MIEQETVLVAARVLHVLGVVLWIGGLAFVTTALIPAIRGLGTESDRIAQFERVESRFAWQARIATLITGASGFYMLHAMDGWSRYLDPAYWWVGLMTFVWLTFMVILFVMEPLFLHRLFLERARRDPERALRFLQRMHYLLLGVSTAAIVGAVVGSHGCIRT